MKSRFYPGPEPNNKPCIIDHLIKGWEQLLDGNHNEFAYHSFLSEYTGLFLAGDAEEKSNSKLKISTSLETGFIGVHDGYSNGNIYGLTELEKPSGKLFTSKDVPVTDFTTALQQGRDCKNALFYKRRRLPGVLSTVSQNAVHSGNFKFTIIIKRRKNPTEKGIEKRAEVKYETGIKIKNFDRLTGKLKRKYFADKISPHDGIMDCDEIYYKRISNPFKKTCSDS